MDSLEDFVQENVGYDEESYPPLITPLPPETVVTKGRRKTNSTKRDKSYWEHVSIAYRKIGKSNGSGFGSGSGSGFGSGPSIRGRVTVARWMSFASNAGLMAISSRLNPKPYQVSLPSRYPLEKPHLQPDLKELRLASGDLPVHEIYVEYSRDSVSSGDYWGETSPFNAPHRNWVV
ncbi:hypothetical protein M9H77_06929 [Catharanthus roseus]|uniref:Uncharacterized protein n=1 Tax=Catharanthus roseus TaxID=4058 RepID=A0ACC0BTH4_CATRO|nr:hypothetical protein M9H77_06929 [Catharanthus roseus]